MATLLSNITEGSIVKIKENGTPVDFYVAKHNYESALNGTGRTLLVRKDCYNTKAWHSVNINAYASSTIDAWLNEDYKALLDASVQEKIGTTAFYYTPGNRNNNVTTLSRGVFLLSVTELGDTDTAANTEGSALPIASSLKIAYLDDTATKQWTRSPDTQNGAYNAWYMNINGDSVTADCDTSVLGIRPALTLHAAETYIFDDGSVEVNVPTISGEDASFGPQHADFNIAYTVTTTDSSAATVTEKVDDTVIRTYTAQSGAAQSMTVSVADLAAGEHTVTITADLNGATAERQYTIVVSPILLAYDETELGTKGANFSIPFSAVERARANITITEAIDGTVKRRYTVASGSQQSMDISVGDLVDGDHIATIQAESGGETTAATFTFTVPAYQPIGGTIQELQDYEGKPVLPITLARAVLTENGASVEAALEHLFEVATAEIVD